MTKLQEVKLVGSSEREVTLEARKMLENLSIKVITLPPDSAFEQRFDLPFLETEDGHRYFGIQGITRFVRLYSEVK